MSLPFGIDAVSPSETAAWSNGLPQDVLERCRTINQLATNFPVGASEQFEDLAPGTPNTTRISNQFTHEYFGGAFESKGHVSSAPFVTMPPLAALAARDGLGVILDPAAEDLDFPTKYGPLFRVQGASASYDLPSAPRHDVHLVGTSGETIWKQRVNRIVNLEALSSGKYYLSSGVYSLTGNRGETTSLALTRPWTSKHYINRMRDLLEASVFTVPTPPSTGHGWRVFDWAGVQQPCNQSLQAFWSLLWRDAGWAASYPFDVNTGAGNPLGFLYEYGLWSGNWQYLAQHWEATGLDPVTQLPSVEHPDPNAAELGIRDIYRPLELFHDWGWMAGSSSVWGGRGSGGDMINSEWTGYLAYAGIARALGHHAEARRARYLAAKAQLTVVMRVAAKEWALLYNHTLDADFQISQVVEGFGENEVTGPLANRNRTVENWADWTISGERLDPIVFEAFKFVHDPYVNVQKLTDVLGEFFGLAGEQSLDTPGQHKIATFAENKLYAAFRMADPALMDRAELITWTDKMYSDLVYPAHAGSTIGVRANGRDLCRSAPRLYARADGGGAPDHGGWLAGSARGQRGLSGAADQSRRCGMSLLSIQSLTKIFGEGQMAVRATDNVSFDVREGECLAIVGESGSGKTTLANMILGILSQTSGQIAFDGKPLGARRSAEERRAIQLVQQNPLSSLNPKRSIGASVRLGLDTYNIGAKSTRWRAVEDALEAVGLPGEMRKRAPQALSGGQRQRVGIARALACNPRLLVLDEPTSALDVLVQARVLRLLNQLRADLGLTYVFITHDLAVVRNIADRVAVFQSGKLVELGDTAQIFSDPQQPYTRSLIGAVPVVDMDELKLRDKLAGRT